MLDSCPGVFAPALSNLKLYSYWVSADCTISLIFAAKIPFFGHFTSNTCVLANAWPLASSFTSAFECDITQVITEARFNQVCSYASRGKLLINR